MVAKPSARSFHEVVQEIDRMPLVQQEELLDIMQRRLNERRRDAIAADVAEGDEEFLAGHLQPKTVDQIMKDIGQ